MHGTIFHPAKRRKTPFTRLEMIAGKSIADDRTGMHIEPKMWAAMDVGHQAGYHRMGKAALDAAFAEMGLIGKLVKWWYS